MKPQTPPNGPKDAEARRQIAPVICYPTDGLPHPDMEILNTSRTRLVKTGEVIVPPRDARCFDVSFPIETDQLIRLCLCIGFRCINFEYQYFNHDLCYCYDVGVLNAE